MIVRGLAGGSGIGVAGSLVAAKHIGETELVRRGLRFHRGVKKGHAVGVRAHDVVEHDQAGESILTFAQRSHIATFVDSRYASGFGDSGGSRGERLGDVGSVGQVLFGGPR
jgi:hypothetical protein